MKTIIAILLIFSGFNAGASLLKDDLNNGRLSIEKLRMNLAYGWADTCIETYEDGYCSRRGETVATMKHHFYTDVFSRAYTTSAGYKTSLICRINFAEPDFYTFKQMLYGVFEIPRGFKEEFRFPFSGKTNPNIPQFDFFVKPLFQMVKVENLYSENKITEQCEGSPNEEVSCWNIRRSTVAFSSNLGSFGRLNFRCDMEADADVPGEQLEITREHFDQITKDQVKVLR